MVHDGVMRRSEEAFSETTYNGTSDKVAIVAFDYVLWTLDGWCLRDKNKRERPTENCDWRRNLRSVSPVVIGPLIGSVKEPKFV